MRTLTLSVSTLALGLAAFWSAPTSAQDAETVKIGYAVSRTGPNAGGANTSTIPNYELWVAQVNERGGLAVGDRRLPIEIVEYDDRSSSEEAVRAVERLITQDEVDFVLAPWGTALNLAVGPIFDRYGYPQLAGAAVTDRAPQLAERWPNSYWLLGTGGSYAEAFVETLSKLRDAGEIGNTVAMASIADGFGIELSNAGRAALEAADFELVLDRTYPVGTQDLAPIVNEARGLSPDVFIAFSYPPDTLGLTDQARVLGFNPPVFYAGVGGAFPLFLDRFGPAAEGVVSLGGIDANSEAVRTYIEEHTAVTGRAPDSWASLVTYAGLQALEQAIEKAGTLDREAVNEQLSTASFETVLGEVSLADHVMPNVWTVGQWQGGQFVGVGPADREGAAPFVFPKPEWPAAQ